MSLWFNASVDVECDLSCDAALGFRGFVLRLCVCGVTIMLICECVFRL